jgi:hypothetical protein
VKDLLDVDAGLFEGIPPDFRFHMLAPAFHASAVSPRQLDGGGRAAIAAAEYAL